MSPASLDAGVFGQLNQEQKALLDTVDSLRSQGVGEIVHLPQIIVVGDQSSGKSSVLEAISRVRFPVKGGICTRFATELVVRTCPQDEVAVTIRRANATGSGGNVGFSERSFDSSALPDLIERAKVSMGVRDDASGFSEDTLRIQVSGPDLPSLTLVDLPGIYRNETADQSREGMQVVWRLVEKYMKQENSIIIAVVNASYDFSNQGILNEVKRYDPSRERTMGIVTNPERQAQKSIDEAKYVRLIRNQEPLHTLKHGWHVLRNRGPEANDERGQGSSRTSDEERDEAERNFLSSGIWASLPEGVKGVDTLRRKLSKVLTKHIQLSLPGVIQKIETTLEARRETLARLGRPRTAPAELRHYLHDIAENFRNLTRLAVRGSYDDLKFFGDACSTDYPCGPHRQSDARRLRAVVRNLNHAFDTVISAKGARRKIIWEDDEADQDNESAGCDNEESDTEDEIPEALSLYTELYDVDDPEEVAWEGLKEELETQASINQNTNFPGSPNDRLALNHFRDQSQRWRSIASMHLGLVTDSAKAFVELALAHVTAGDDGTRDALLREYVDPFFEQRASRLEEKLDELLRHYKDGEALMLETEFMRSLSALEKRRVAQQVKDLLDSEQSAETAGKGKDKLSRREVEQLVRNALETRISRFCLEKVVDMATVYYEVCHVDHAPRWCLPTIRSGLLSGCMRWRANHFSRQMSLRTFTENVIILAVENCLISELPSILASSIIHEMDEEKLTTLAAESSDLRQERFDSERDIRVLTEGLRICKKNRPRQSAGEYSGVGSVFVLALMIYPPAYTSHPSARTASIAQTNEASALSNSPASTGASPPSNPTVLPLSPSPAPSVVAAAAAKKPLFSFSTAASSLFDPAPETKPSSSGTSQLGNSQRGIVGVHVLNGAASATGNGLLGTDTKKVIVDSSLSNTGVDLKRSGSATPKPGETAGTPAPSTGLFGNPVSGNPSGNWRGFGNTTQFGAPFSTTSSFGGSSSGAPAGTASGPSIGLFGSGTSSSRRDGGLGFPPAGSPKVGGVTASTLTATPSAPGTKGELPRR